jgi:predicted Fe-S protein YdhL (DUF1289 family)
MSDGREIKSPCINVCELNSAQICVGCWRHIDEIVAWRQLSDEQRRAVIARSANRREAISLQEAAGLQRDTI